MSDTTQTEDLLAGALNRLKVIPDAKALELRAKALENRFDQGKLWTAAKVPLRHAEAQALDRSGPWGQTFEKLRSKLGNGFLIALIGTRGSGKTQLGVELIRHEVTRLVPAAFSSTTRFLMAIKATYRKDSKESEEDVLDLYRKPALLVLDELGRRGETDWEDRLLFELLNDRYNAVKDTLLISNHTPADFEASVGPSLVSRINETGGIIDCAWGSYRT